MGTIASSPSFAGRDAPAPASAASRAVPAPPTLAETLRLRFRAREFRVVRLGVRIGRLLDVVAELRRLVCVLASGGGGGGYPRRPALRPSDDRLRRRPPRRLLRGRARTFSRTLTLTARVESFAGAAARDMARSKMLIAAAPC